MSQFRWLDHVVQKTWNPGGLDCRAARVNDRRDLGVKIAIVMCVPFPSTDGKNSKTPIVNASRNVVFTSLLPCLFCWLSCLESEIPNVSFFFLFSFLRNDTLCFLLP